MWSIENIPMSQFDSFEDWYGSIQDNIGGASESEEFQDMAYQEWVNSGMEDRVFRDSGQQQEQEFISPQNTVDARININTGEVESIQPIGQQTPIPVKTLPRVEEERPIPQTGKAPELLKVNVIVKQSFLQRIKRFFRR